MRKVTEYNDLTGRTEAVDSVQVRARVWGYVDKFNFKEGMLVKKGEVLFLKSGEGVGNGAGKLVIKL